MSGILINATPAARAAPQDAFADLAPLTPTARRRFATTDRVIALARVYQSAPQFVPGTITTRLTDGQNAVIAEVTEPLEGRTTGQISTADFQIDVPVADLSAGEYLLTIEVQASGKSAKRDVRLRVN